MNYDNAVGKRIGTTLQSISSMKTLLSSFLNICRKNKIGAKGSAPDLNTITYRLANYKRVVNQNKKTRNKTLLSYTI
jgi:hypothetical protein